MADQYEYDIFISYRRLGNASKWVEEHFVPTLIDCLAFELDRAPIVFFDSELGDGTTWPTELGRKLARSRMLISLWSKTYLNSEWCAMELAHMRARENEVGLRTVEKPEGLIAICVIHDGEELPGELAAIQSFEVRDYFNIRMRRDSEAAEKLERLLRSKAGALAKIIKSAPDCKPHWATDAAKAFYASFKAKIEPSQDQKPSFTGQ